MEENKETKIEGSQVEVSPIEQTTPPAPVPEKPKRKLKLPIIIAAVIFLLIFVLPAPYHTGRIVCKPDAKCPPSNQWVITYPFFFSYILSNAHMLQSILNPAPPRPVKIPTAPTPTPSATDNWKTFTNTRYGYSLKFPPNLYSAIQASSSYDAEESDNVQLCPCPPGNKIYGPGAFNGPLVIYVKPNSENLSLIEYINKTRPSLIKQEDITLDKTPAIKGHTEVGGDVLIASEGIYAIKNGNIYSITFLLSGTNDGDELRQFSEIISTFKFTN